MIIRNLGILLVLLTLATHSHADDIAVIANPKAGFDSLTKAEARLLFLGKNKSLPSHQTAIPLMHVEASPLRIRFDRAVMDRDPKQSRAYWAQMIFTGRGKPPRQLNNDNEVKQEVSRNPDAIGYINASAVDNTVKVVLRISP